MVIIIIIIIIIIININHYRRVGDKFLAEARDFSLLYNIQLGSGVRPASYTAGAGFCFPQG
jgi:hypothetical protein